MCIFHKWSKWEQYDVKVPERMLSEFWRISGATYHMQKKTCKKCGKVKVEKYGQTVH